MTELLAKKKAQRCACLLLLHQIWCPREYSPQQPHALCRHTVVCVVWPHSSVVELLSLFLLDPGQKGEYQSVTGTTQSTPQGQSKGHLPNQRTGASVGRPGTCPGAAAGVEDERGTQRCASNQRRQGHGK